MKGNDTLPNLDFGEWARARARPFTCKYEQAQVEHEQSWASTSKFWNFPIFGCFEPDITDFVNNLCRKMTISKHRILGSPEFQTSKFFNVGHFEPDITDFMKNLWREMTSSQIWILVAEHELAHGHHTFSAGIRFPILRFPFPYIPVFACFCRKPYKHCCFCTCLSENIVNIVVFGRGLQKTL